MALAQEPRSLNPLFNDGVADVEEINHLYNDRLWVYDEHGVLAPQLARRVPTMANGDIAPDGRTITIHLRADARWQDGVPFTSSDVRFSWQAVMNPKNNAGSTVGYDQVARIDAPAADTVVLHLRRRYARALTSALPEFVPEHLLRNVDMNLAAFSAAPVGTGPFKVVEWKRGDALELVANDAYYRGKPHLRAITVKFVPSATTRALMLTTRELELAPLDRETYRQLAESPDAGAGQVVFAVAPERAFSAIFLNVTRPALRDVRVRRALAAAVDRRTLVRNSAYAADVATIGNGYNGPLSFAYDPHAPAPGYDPARAARLLDAAGWRVGPDGIRTNGTRRLALLLLARAGRTTEIGVATQLQAMLRRVGIEVTIQSASSEILFAPPESGGLLATGKYDLVYTSYFASFDPDSSWILRCDQVEPRGDNESRYCNPQLDALEAAGLATYDLAARKRIYAQIDRLVDRDVPMIYVSWPTIVYGMNVHLLGVAFNGTSATWNADRWQFALHVDPHRWELTPPASKPQSGARDPAAPSRRRSPLDGAEAQHIRPEKRRAWLSSHRAPEPW